MKLLKIIGFTLGGLILLVAILFVYTTFINPKSPREQTTFTQDELSLSVDYSSPFKRDRLIFGKQEDNALVPYGNYWRLGANMATRLKNNQPIGFAGRPLAAGDYRLYVIPYADHWIIAVHSDPIGSGASTPDPKEDIMRVQVPVMSSEEVSEQLTINFIEKANTLLLRFHWDTTLINIPIN